MCRLKAKESVDGYILCHFKLVFRPLVKGNEHSENEIILFPEPASWARDAQKAAQNISLLSVNTRPSTRLTSEF